MLEVTGLKAGYGAVGVLHGIDVSVAEGEIVALLGSNGVGKSTFSSVISGLLKCHSGTVVFEGEPIQARTPEAIVARGLIQVPEGRHIFPNMSVLENLQLGAYRRGQKNRARNLDRVASIFPRLRERLSQKAGSLSGGEQQMLAIGRGLMSEPRMLVLDEPSIGLSPLLVEEMFGLIETLHKDGLTILLIEQNVLQSIEIASRAFVMEGGAIRLSGRSKDLLESPDLQRAYLGLSK